MTAPATLAGSPMPAPAGTVGIDTNTVMTDANLALLKTYATTHGQDIKFIGRYIAIGTWSR